MTAVKPKPSGGFEIASSAAEQISVGPNTANAQGWAARQSNRKACGIGIAYSFRASLAAAAFRFAFDQIGCPNHATGDPHCAIYRWNITAIAGGLYAQLFQARALDSFAAKYAAVDHLSQHRTNSAANRAANKPPNRAQNNRCHAVISCLASHIKSAKAKVLASTPSGPILRARG